GAEGASNVFEGHGLGLDGDVVDLAEGGVDGVEGALSLVQVAAPLAGALQLVVEHVDGGSADGVVAEAAHGEAGGELLLHAEEAEIRARDASERRLGAEQGGYAGEAGGDGSHAEASGRNGK